MLRHIINTLRERVRSARLLPAVMLGAALLLPLAMSAVAKKGAKANAPEDDCFVIVIDAGHGGKDVGARGTSANEKSVNLAVAKKLRDIIKREHDAKDVKVVMTRDADFFVTLQGRCDIANKAKGNLFVSIHCNSADEKNPRRTTVKGASVYTLGLGRSKENLDVAKRENSVMMLEPDYSTTYMGFDPNSAESYIMFEMNQNRHLNQSIKFAALAQRELCSTAARVDKGVKQDIFWVLVHTGMPAVLVELDFICNPTVERFMTSDDGVDKMARSLANAFNSYYKSLNRK